MILASCPGFLIQLAGQILDNWRTKISTVGFRFAIVLIPLALWMVIRGPTDGIAVAGDNQVGRDIFVQNCALCHVHGVAMAPRIGSKGDWESILPNGRKYLLNSVLRGKGGMPPKGGNASISDVQAEAGLDYMLEVLGNSSSMQARSRQGSHAY